MNHAMHGLRSLRVDAEPPPLDAMLVTARARVHRRSRLRSLGGGVAGVAVAVLAVLAPTAVRGPGPELNGGICAPAFCTAWSPPQPLMSEDPAICGLHEVACLSEWEG